MRLSKAQPEHLAALAAIHAHAFRGFLLTRLGPLFLKLLYGGFSYIDGGICFVASDKGRLVGFVAGTTRPEGFFRELLLQQWWRFGLAALQGLLRSPIEVTRRCLSAVFYRGEVPASIGGRPALLSSLAVHPDCSGRGIGKALVAAFAAEVRKGGCDSVYLLTDKTDNEAVNRFYERCGFELLDTLQRGGGRTMNRWLMQIPSTRTVMVH